MKYGFREEWWYRRDWIHLYLLCTQRLYYELLNRILNVGRRPGHCHRKRGKRFSTSTPLQNIEDKSLSPDAGKCFQLVLFYGLVIVLLTEPMHLLQQMGIARCGYFQTLWKQSSKPSKPFDDDDKVNAVYDERRSKESHMRILEDDEKIENSNSDNSEVAEVR